MTFTGNKQGFRPSRLMSDWLLEDGMSTILLLPFFRPFAKNQRGQLPVYKCDEREFSCQKSRIFSPLQGLIFFGHQAKPFRVSIRPRTEHDTRSEDIPISPGSSAEGLGQA
ncbi:hypothetical protein J0A68_06550 [Algoriphagus sp. H41]|uniref:Uncharacterized protein n=1 Tax=Algoriphagus oliviformis TaxID=2811231 RepID=A0ABS3C0G1_9BACT|nr:hypothetical protein [Algoriphagus oliviformis]MBN7810605.1 hypothetical protein [Algoriphagus oliviformis]